MKYSYLALTSALAILAYSGTASSAPAAKLAAKAKPKAAGALSVQTSETLPKFGPAPAWVTEQAIPKSNPKRKEDPFELLLSNSQEYLTSDGVENYVEYVVKPLTQAGLQAFGNVALPWNVYRTDFTLHRVSIERDGKSIDALDRSNVSVIRRETQLEQSTLTGVRTVVMPIKGVQVGDTLRVAATYKTRAGGFGKTEEIQDLTPPLSIGRMVRRFVVSKDLPVRWIESEGLKPASSNDTGTTIERVYVVENFEPPKERKYVPDRFAKKLVQVSSFSDWNEVAVPIAPLFDTARKTSATSEVSQLADKISADHKDPRDRLRAALQASQDQVRYVALLLGDSDYTPMTADEVWSQRFGDCKGKTALLLALLDRMGIQADPMLVSVKFDDGLDQRLPTLALFDHVIVRAHVDGETYYLDGTQFGQRTLEELRQSPTTNGLPLVANTKLVKTPDVMPSAPLSEASLVWDARQGLIENTPFEATLTLRGSVAADMRLQAANSTDREKFIEKLKNKVPGVSNDSLEHVSTEADAPDGSYVVKFKGTADLDWSPVEGLKGNRLQLSQSTLSWDDEFDRNDEAGKAIPVLMAFPYWERMVEKVLLPNAGKDFVLDANAIDKTIAVTNMSRSVTMADGVVTSISDFRRLKREMDPDTARAAKSALDEIGEDYAYVVSRKKLKIASD